MRQRDEASRAAQGDRLGTAPPRQADNHLF